MSDTFFVCERNRSSIYQYIYVPVFFKLFCLRVFRAFSICRLSPNITFSPCNITLLNSLGSTIHLRCFTLWKPSCLKYFVNFTKFSSTPLRKFSVDIIGKIFRCCMHVPGTCSRSEFLKQPIKSLIKKLFLTDLYHKKKLSKTLPFIVSQFNNYMYVSCTFADQ